ncbi:MAG: class II aldolase/adducin family protein [Clostridia bacterium]
MKDSNELRQSVIDACRWLGSNGYVFGTWGNISVRLDDGNILITPTKLSYECMEPCDLVVISPKGDIVSGTRIPTSERAMHIKVMEYRKDMNVIIHDHSPYALAVCALGEEIPAITEEMGQLLGGSIPVTDRFIPSVRHEELADAVVKSIKDRSAILMRNHGPVCLGRTLDEALVTCQVVEKSAMIYLHISGFGHARAITDAEVKTGRDFYLNSYGKAL